MHWRLHWSLFLLTLPNFEGKEPELPLCPTNIQFFPQNLPMHCRMPTADLQNNQSPTAPPFPPPFYKSPPSGPDSQPIPIPLPSGIPGPMPGMMPGVMPGTMPGAMPGMMPIPGAMPMPMPGPQVPGHKLPVIVMPFYSPDNSFKKQPRPRPNKRFHHRKRLRPRYIHDTDSSDTDTSSNELTDSSESEGGLWKGLRSRRSRSNKRHREKRRRHERQELLTPVLQYVTKDGYVIFEKKISKEEANDWLKVKEDIEVTTHSKQEIDEFEDVEPGEIKHVKEKGNVEVITERNQKHHRKKKYRLQKKVEE